MSRFRSPALLGLVCLTGASCFHGGYRQCRAPETGQIEREPVLLSRTGLTEGLPSVHPYRPRFELWTDGADKRRWVYIPPGTKIDTSDPDEWVFPVGTKLWKEFSRQGRRLETRLLHKTGPVASDWTALAYTWNPEGTDAIAAPIGATNVLGTEHDVPSAADCMGCHGGRKSRVLGLSAVQLGFVSNLRSNPLDEALEALFTHPLPKLDFPGTGQEEAALGYLHANCSHCHNQTRPPRMGVRCYDPEKSFDLSLTWAALSGEAAFPAQATTQSDRLVPGAPDESLILKRMTQASLFRPRMPNLGTEHLDEAGSALVRRWIAGMP